MIALLLWTYLREPVVWQQDAGALYHVWYYLNRELSIGNFSVSIASFVFGVLIIVITLIIAHTLSAFLERRISRRANFDPGLRYTIARLVYYLLITGGVLLAMSQALDVSLTSLAVLFTALSVGIGFGLQNLAADIASGFILLFERPIRVGDRITIDKDEGDIRSINLRTTLVTTNDNISIIVPNSKLVTQRVINWSYGDPRARISIPVGVAYGSDVQLVTDTLLRAAEEVDNVLKDPPPRVQLLKFGDYSLDFRLLVWTALPRRHTQIRSDINYRIFELFRERGIEIPYPQLRLLQQPDARERADVWRELSDDTAKH